MLFCIDICSRFLLVDSTVLLKVFDNKIPYQMMMNDETNSIFDKYIIPEVSPPHLTV